MRKPRRWRSHEDVADARGRAVPRLLVARFAGEHARGKLVLGSLTVPCALGRNGIRRGKREGDGATPAGRFACVSLFRRADRVPGRATRLPSRATREWDGWCDDPADRRYNRRVDLPFSPRHETLWRADGLYDLVVVLDHNLRHPRPGRGSAVFLHVAGPGGAPTAGCVALRLADLVRILPRIGPGTRLVIQG